MDAPSVATSRPAWKDIAYGSVSRLLAKATFNGRFLMHQCFSIPTKAAGMVSKVFEVGEVGCGIG